MNWPQSCARGALTKNQHACLPCRCCCCCSGLLHTLLAYHPHLYLQLSGTTPPTLALILCHCTCLQGTIQLAAAAAQDQYASAFLASQSDPCIPYAALAHSGQGFSPTATSASAVAASQPIAHSFSKCSCLQGPGSQHFPSAGAAAVTNS